MCASLGSGNFKQLFEAPGIADAVDFRLSPAVNLNSNPAAAIADFAPIFFCFDEDTCDNEELCLCAFDQAKLDQAAQVEFLVCMDEKGANKTHAQQCAEQSRSGAISWANVSQCFGDGSVQPLGRGAELLKAANQHWLSFLDTHPGQSNGVPTIMVGDYWVMQYWHYTTLLDATCEAIEEAGAKNLPAACSAEERARAARKEAEWGRTLPEECNHLCGSHPPVGSSVERLIIV